MRLAARIEARLRFLSARERTLLLFCALAVAAFVLVRGVVYPARAQYAKDRAKVRERHAELLRSRAIGEGRTGVAEELAAADEQLAKAEEGLLSGSDPSAAGAALQGLVKPMVDRPDTRLTSVRSVSPVPRGEYVEVAVQMDMQTSLEGLASFLAEVPRQQKILRVKKLTVSSPAYSPALAARSQALRVALTVAGLAAAPQKEAQEKGEAP